MSRLPRPYIPLDVRLDVATRQIQTLMKLTSKPVYPDRLSLRRQLDEALASLKDILKTNSLDLDHDPALVNRRKIHNRRGEIIRYVPDANDPRFLFYRASDGHDIKTRVRGDHGQYSDLMLAKRERRRLRKKRKYRWASRSIPSRPFNWRKP